MLIPTAEYLLYMLDEARYRRAQQNVHSGMALHLGAQPIASALGCICRSGILYSLRVKEAVPSGSH